MPTEPTETLTMLEFGRRDFPIAQEFARRLGYGSDTAYTSTSAIWGLFCNRQNPEHAKPGQNTRHSGCVIKTREVGFLFVSSLEDHNFADLMETERRNAAHDRRKRAREARQK